MLILVGAGLIIYEAARSACRAAGAREPRRGHRGDRVTIVINLVVSAFLCAARRQFGSPALEGDAAHLFTDALSSIGVLVGLVAVAITDEAVFDAIAAMVVALAIVSRACGSCAARAGCWLTRRRRPRSWTGSRPRSPPPRSPRWSATTSCARGRAGRRRWMDLHVQFRDGTSLERAHEAAHQLRDVIRAQVPGRGHPDPRRARRARCARWATARFVGASRDNG